MKKIAMMLTVVIFVLSLCSKVSVSAEGKLLLPAVVHELTGAKWGFIDEAGSFVIKPTYDIVREYNVKGVAIVAKGRSEYDICTIWFIDKSGKVLCGPFKANVPEFENGVAILKGEGYESWVVNESGKVVLTSNNKLFHSYQEGLLQFSHKNAEGKEQFGFMDITGKIVIPAQYSYAYPFTGGKAVVSTGESSYAVIDKKGKVLATSKEYLRANNISEGFCVFYDEKSKMYGYKQTDGKVIISPRFKYAEDFKDGFAVVTVGKAEYELKYGLINKSGAYVIKPEYSGIQYLGQGLYAVSQDFTNYYTDLYSPKAIFNNQGKQLTGYKYYTVYKFENGAACASDGITTFFIDTSGNMVSKLPKLNGVGTMTLKNEIITAKIDGHLSYLKKDGSKIWDEDETITLSNNVKVKSIKYRRDYLTFIEYPEIQNLASKDVQSKINQQLKALFISEYSGEKIQKEGELDGDVQFNFQVGCNKDLLIIERTGYIYPIGAAHGMPLRSYYHINMKTGTFYKLSDLFKSGSKYTEKLEALIKEQMRLNTRIDVIFPYIGYSTEEPQVLEDQGFVLGKDSITVYYHPYDLTAYAFGFPEFEISYGQLADVLNTGGDLWKAFDKTIVQSKTKIISNIDSSAANSLASLLKTYESKMIEAINTNDFNKVNSCLLSGSSLYHAQKDLVKNLYNKGTKEKLTKYELYAVAYDSTKKEYKLFVLETVAIQYAGKDFVNKDFSWCYTAKYDNNTKSYRLSNIEKW